MCGRYVLKIPRTELITAFALYECDDYDLRYNAAPLQFMPVIRQRPNGERVGHLLRWGLIPGWSRDEAIATKLINARAETLAEKPSFRAAYHSRRCIIPASGFYEWLALPGGKQPYYIHPAAGRLLGFAGLWERCYPPQAEPLDTFTIITTRAADSMGEIHERMPVILDPEDYLPWLARDTELDFVRQLLRQSVMAPLQMHPVGKAVGNVKNEGPKLIEPLES